MFRANTTVSIMRGTTTDGYGDERDTQKPVRTNVIASIIQASPGVGTRAAQVQTPDTTTPRTIRSYSGRLVANTDVRDGDRLKDERNGRVFIVDAITAPDSPVNTPDLHLELRRIT